MRNINHLCMVGLGIVVLAACGAEASPSTSQQYATDQVVRRYIDFRNQGDLDGLLSISCDDLYISARNLLKLPDGQRRDVIESMRRHPVEVQNVIVDRAANFRYDATLVASVGGQGEVQTGTQHIIVREYQDGYRVCKMNP